MMNKNKNQKGAISLFVLLSMLFFIAFMIGTFSLVSRRNAIQEQALKETQDIYKSGASAKDIYDSMLSTTGTVIPISTKEQLTKLVEITENNTSANYMIDGKMYTYTKDANYILKNNIILDLKDEVDGKNNITIYDYILYSGDYNIDTNGYDIYYTQTDGSIWKCVCYQNMGTKTIDERKFSTSASDSYYYGKSYHADRYSILQAGLGKYKQEWAGIECFELMLMYNCDNKKFDSDNTYNRWRQTNNPVTETKVTGETKAIGYYVQYYDASTEYYSGKNGIDPLDYYWGGLMQSGISYYYLTGGMQSNLIYYYVDYYTNDIYYYDDAIQYYYPVANTNFDGYYGMNVTDTINASECLLFVRVK